MDIVISIICLFFVPGVIVGTIILFLLKHNAKIKSKTPPDKAAWLLLPFFVNFFYGVYSALKFIGGNGAFTPSETISWMDMSSYRNFAIRSGAILVALLLVFFFWFKEKTLQFVYAQLSCAISLTAALFVFQGKWAVATFATGIFVVSFGFAFIYSVLLKRDVSLFSLGKFKHRIQLGLPAVLLWATMMFFVLPGELYFRNIDEIAIRYLFMALAGVVAILITTVLLEGCLLLCTTDLMYDLTVVFIFAVTLIGYVQELFLNGRMFLLDFSSKGWEPRASLINLIVWVVVIVAVIAAFIKIKKMRRIIPGICVFILAVRLVTVAVVGLTTEAPERITVSPEGSLTLSKNNNVVVFVLDAYDTQILDKVLSRDPDFLEPLSDFIFYDNMTSEYAFTEMEIPYLLSGTQWDEDPETDYRDYAYENSSMVRTIADNGYSVGIYTDSFVISPQIVKHAFNCTESFNQKVQYWELVKLMIRSSKYLTMPFRLKEQYSYATESFKELYMNEDFWSTSDDSIYYHELFEKGLAVDTKDGNKDGFRFIHLKGAHAPFSMDEHGNVLTATDDYAGMVPQAIGTFEIVFEYIRQLKELGLYDNTSILITADHGQNFTVDGISENQAKAYELELPSSPILFVKEAGQHNPDQEMQVSHVPARQADLIETVRQLTGGHPDEPLGKLLSEIKEDDNPTRYMKVFRSDVPLRVYEITGDVHDPDNWKHVR